MPTFSWHTFAIAPPRARLARISYDELIAILYIAVDGQKPMDSECHTP
jgi:hypothetical protein